MTTTTLTSKLSSLEDFALIVVIVVSLVRNMFWTFVFLKQLGAQCSKIEQIIQGYFNGTLADLTSCAITPTTGSITLVETTCTTSSLFYFIVIGFFNMTNFTTVWIGKLLFNNNIGDYRLYNQFWFWVGYQGIIICYDWFTSQIIATSLCLIKVSLTIPIAANLRYGCKPVMKIVIRNT